MQGSETRRWPMRKVCSRGPLPSNTWQEGCARPKWHPTKGDSLCPQGTGLSILWQTHPQYCSHNGYSPYSHQSNKARSKTKTRSRSSRRCRIGTRCCCPFHFAFEWQQQHHWRSPRLSGNRKGQKQFLAVNKQNSQTIAIVLFVGVQQPRRLRS